MLLTKIHDSATETGQDTPIQTGPTEKNGGRARPGPLETCDNSEPTEGGKNACSQLEWFVTLREQSGGQNHDQLIAEIKDRVGKVMRLHPELEYRIELVPNTGMAKLTKISSGRLPMEVGKALDEALLAFKSSLSGMKLEMSFPARSLVAPVYFDMYMAVQGYYEHKMADDDFSGDIPTVVAAYLENGGRYTNIKAGVNLDYANGAQVVGIGGEITLVALKEIYVWLAENHAEEKRVLGVNDMGNLVLTEWGKTVVLPSKVEPGAVAASVTGLRSII